jgi:DNA-binding IclR family transcriptional regulator
VIRGQQPEGEGYLPRAEGADGPQGTTSLRHGLEILGLFSSERRWLRIGEIAAELGLNPLDAHAQVSAMRRMRFVRQGPGRRYGLGPGPRDVAMDAVRATGVARRTRAHLLDLQRDTGCSVVLAMLDGTELLVVDRAAPAAGAQAAGGQAADGQTACPQQGESPKVEMTIGLDRRAPFHATALGKVLLAYLPEHHEQSLVERLALEAFTPRTITDKAMLFKHLQDVRRQGLASEDREHLPHRRCLAAPVRGGGRRVVAAVGVRLRELDTPLQALVERYRPSLLAAAAQLSEALRYARLDWLEL